MNEQSDIDKAKAIKEFFNSQKKMLIFSWIPIFTLTAFMIFRRLKLTIVEFTIPAVIAVIGASIFNILLSSLELYDLEHSANEILKYLYNSITLILGLALIFFPLFTFWTFLKGHYSTLGKIWRLIIFYLISFTTLLVILGLVIAYLIN